MIDLQATPELSAPLPVEPTEGPDAAVGRLLAAAWHLGSVMACLSGWSRNFHCAAGVGHKRK